MREYRSSSSGGDGVFKELGVGPSEGWSARLGSAGEDNMSQYQTAIAEVTL